MARSLEGERLSREFNPDTELDGAFLLDNTSEADASLAAWAWARMLKTASDSLGRRAREDSSQSSGRREREDPLLTGTHGVDDHEAVRPPLSHPAHLTSLAG